jgi:hypothetical protein
MDDIADWIESLHVARVFREIPLCVDREEMLRRTGLGGRKRPVAQSLLSEFEDTARAVDTHRLVRSAAVVRIARIVASAPDRVVLDGGISLHGTLLQRRAPHATHMALAICTIGGDIEERASALKREDLLTSLMFDGIGSAAVDTLAAEVNQRLCRAAEQMQLTAGAPLVFGTPGLPLQNLEALFKMLPAYDIGVRLTPGCCMVPRKTVAFGTGIGPAMPAWSRGQACVHCGLSGSCRYRK